MLKPLLCQIISILMDMFYFVCVLAKFMQCSWVHICVLCPRGTSCTGRLTHRFQSVKACWEALIQFQPRVLLRQLDNEGQQRCCTFEMSKLGGLGVQFSLGLQLPILFVID